MLVPPGVVIIPPGWVRCVVTNVGPTLVQIVQSGCRRGGRSGAVEGGVVRADQAGLAALFQAALMSGQMAVSESKSVGR